MRLRNTIVLLAILAILGTYVYLGEIRGRSTQQAEAPQTTVLQIPSDSVRRLEVQTSEGVAVLKRDEGQPWWIEQPVQYEADEGRVNSILSSLSDLQATRTLTDTLNLSDFGLATPVMTVTVGLADGSSEQLLVGDQNPDGSAYYVQKAGESNVHLVYLSVIDDLKRLVTEPPKKPTPTPTSTATPTTAETPTALPIPTTTPSP